LLSRIFGRKVRTRPIPIRAVLRAVETIELRVSVGEVSFSKIDGLEVEAWRAALRRRPTYAPKIKNASPL